MHNTIFITVKSNSVRCPNKNTELLPYSIEKLKLLNDVDIVVITDSISFRMFEGIDAHFYIEKPENQHGELLSIYNYIQSTNKDIDNFVLFSVCHPFLNIETINNVLQENIEKYDMITTYSNVYNRSIFLLDDKFKYKYKSYERKGCLCPEEKMVDGSIYKINTEFLKRSIKSNNFNHYFWNKSKIKFIKNTSKLFLDVDTPEDLELFYLLKDKIKLEDL